jgi:hypothetical protein
MVLDMGDHRSHPRDRHHRQRNCRMDVTINADSEHERPDWDPHRDGQPDVQAARRRAQDVFDEQQPKLHALPR